MNLNKKIMSNIDNIELYHELGYDIENIKLEKVNKIEYLEKESEVYDLEINETHNYVTEVGIAHNGGGRH